MASKQKFCSVDLWAVDERVLASIRGTGLEYFRDIARDLGNNQHSNDLVRALFAMYDNQNYCFSLSQSSGGNKPKNLFFGCEDIVYSTGLSVMGELVTNDKNHYAVVEGSGYRVDGLPLLKADTKLKGKHRSSISLNSLRKQFESVPITADEQQLEGHTNAYVLYLAGTVIVPTTNSYVPLGYLGSIVKGKYRKSAWGAAMLAHIHHCLGLKRNYLGGNMYVLIVWAFEHIKDLLKAVFPGEYQKSDGRIDRAKLPNIYPLSLAWAKLISKKFGNKHLGRHLNFKQLDCKEVTWRPYTRFSEDFLPPERQSQLIMKFYRGAILHPMHNNGHPIYHYPEKAPRHLGPGVKNVMWNEVCDLVPHRKRYDSETLMLFQTQWDRKEECLVQLLDENDGVINLPYPVERTVEEVSPDLRTSPVSNNGDSSHGGERTTRSFSSSPFPSRNADQFYNDVDSSHGEEGETRSHIHNAPDQNVDSRIEDLASDPDVRKGLIDKGYDEANIFDSIKELFKSGYDEDAIRNAIIPEVDSGRSFSSIPLSPPQNNNDKGHFADVNVNEVDNRNALDQNVKTPYANKLRTKITATRKVRDKLTGSEKKKKDSEITRSFNIRVTSREQSLKEEPKRKRKNQGKHKNKRQKNTS